MKVIGVKFLTEHSLSGILTSRAALLHFEFWSFLRSLELDMVLMTFSLDHTHTRAKQWRFESALLHALLPTVRLQDLDRKNTNSSVTSFSVDA